MFVGVAYHSAPLYSKTGKLSYSSSTCMTLPRQLYPACACTSLSIDHTPLSPGDRDVFDKLFEEAPEKLEAVKRVSDVLIGCVKLSMVHTHMYTHARTNTHTHSQSLCQFATRVLSEMEVIISDVSTQVHTLTAPHMC